MYFFSLSSAKWRTLWFHATHRWDPRRHGLNLPFLCPKAHFLFMERMAFIDFMDFMAFMDRRLFIGLCSSSWAAFFMDLLFIAWHCACTLVRSMQISSRAVIEQVRLVSMWGKPSSIAQRIRHFKPTVDIAKFPQTSENTIEQRTKVRNAECQDHSIHVP